MALSRKASNQHEKAANKKEGAHVKHIVVVAQRGRLGLRRPLRRLAVAVRNLAQLLAGLRQGIRGCTGAWGRGGPGGEGRAACGCASPTPLLRAPALLLRSCSSPAPCPPSVHPGAQLSSPGAHPSFPSPAHRLLDLHRRLLVAAPALHLLIRLRVGGGQVQARQVVVGVAHLWGDFRIKVQGGSGSSAGRGGFECRGQGRDGLGVERQRSSTFERTQMHD